jgi:glutaredoxin
MVVDCPWCKFNPQCDKADSCDFRSLPYEKDAIIERVKKENAEVEKIKSHVLQDREQYKVQEKMLRDAFDKMAGVKIMCDRLEADFKMTELQIREACGLKSLTLLQKAKLVMIAQQFKMNRGSKR